MEKTSTLYALLVGVRDYRAESGLSDVPGAVNDVLRLEETLKRRMGLRDENRKILHSDLDYEKPLKNNILMALDSLSSLPMKEEDTFLFYFAGHGFKGYLMSEDALNTSPMVRERTALDLQRDVVELMDQMTAGQSLMILDACREDPLGRGEGSHSESRRDESMTRSILPWLGDAQMTRPSRNYPQRRGTLFACQEGEVAYDYPAEDCSWFGLHLREQLEKASDSELLIPDLFARVKSRMQETAGIKWKKAAGQLPDLCLSDEADPARLWLRPIQRRIRPAAPSNDAEVDPENEEIEDFSIDEITVDEATSIVEEEDIAPAPAGLPPLNPELKEYTRRLKGIARAMEQLRDGSHPQLEKGRATVGAAKNQYLRLQSEEKRHQIEMPQKLREQLLEASLAGDTKRKLQLRRELQGVEIRPFMAYGTRMANASRVRQEWERTEEEFQESVKTALKSLEARADQMKLEMEAARLRDMEGVFGQVLGGVSSSMELEDRMLDWLDELSGRYIGVSEEDLFQHALKWYEYKNQLKKMDPRVQAVTLDFAQAFQPNVGEQWEIPGLGLKMV